MLCKIRSRPDILVKTLFAKFVYFEIMPMLQYIGLVGLLNISLSVRNVNHDIITFC